MLHPLLWNCIGYRKRSHGQVTMATAKPMTIQCSGETKAGGQLNPVYTSLGRLREVVVICKEVVISYGTLGSVSLVIGVSIL